MDTSYSGHEQTVSETPHPRSRNETILPLQSIDDIFSDFKEPTTDDQYIPQQQAESTIIYDATRKYAGKAVRLTLVQITEMDENCEPLEKINAHVSGCPIDRRDPQFKYIEEQIKDDVSLTVGYGKIYEVYPSAA